MVYQPEKDNLDRPRGILSPADREYLLSDKSGYSHQAQYKRNKVIKERIINALLDFTIIENYLNEDMREEVFEHFDANKLFDDDVKLETSETHHVSCLTNIIAFIYRETKEQTGVHPPFAMSLEHGITRGEFEPGTTYYGRHKVNISFEKLPEQRVNVESIIDRIEHGAFESLSEQEMRAIIEIMARSDSADPSNIEREFTEWVEEFEEENGRYPNNMAEIFSQRDHGNPHEYILVGRNSEHDDAE